MPVEGKRDKDQRVPEIKECLARGFPSIFKQEKDKKADKEVQGGKGGFEKEKGERNVA